MLVNIRQQDNDDKSILVQSKGRKIRTFVLVCLIGNNQASHALM